MDHDIWGSWNILDLRPHDKNLKILFYVLKTILKENYTFNLSIIVYITELQLICIVVVALISNLHLKGLGRELVTPLF